MNIIQQMTAYFGNYTINLHLIPIFVESHVTVLMISLAMILFCWGFVPFAMNRKHHSSTSQSSYRRATVSNPSAPTITSQDIRSIAGDDVFATQLDLARAYIEMGKKNLARKIILHVIKQGGIIHQLEANQLLKNVD